MKRPLPLSLFLMVVLVVMVAIPRPIVDAQQVNATDIPGQDDPVLETPDPNVPNNGIFRYLPIVFKVDTFRISGFITDGDNKPLPGVAVLDDAGRSVTTNVNGYYEMYGFPRGQYAISPSSPEYLFSPAVRDVWVNGDVSGVNFVGMSRCYEGIINGGFEVNSGWSFPITTYTADYTTTIAHTGNRSARTGIPLSTGVNKYSYSDTYQQVTIPNGSSRADLYLWLYHASSEPTTTAIPEVPVETKFGDVPLASDAQYVLILDKNGNIEETLLWTRKNTQTWTLYQFNLAQYAGQTIRLQIGTYNDGSSGVTVMYADDISLKICSSTLPPEPPPSDCQNQIKNSGFETYSDWGLPVTSYSADYSSEKAYQGSRSMRTGIVNPSQNRYSYSDAWQTVYISPATNDARLRLWVYPLSGETYSQAPQESQLPQVGQIWGEMPLANDAQYVLILDPNTLAIKERLLYWQTSNTQKWTYQEFSLTKYAGQYIRLQFGTYNDGYIGVTAMYVDEVYIDVCKPGTPPPTPPPSPGCSEYISNGGFEADLAWEIPITEYSAGYSTWLYRSGYRSMRTGIVYPAHNRDSYSDFRQAVYIPSDATSVTLSTWLYPISGEGSTSLIIPQAEPMKLGQALSTSGSDVQYLLILDQWGNWIDTLIWQRQNTQAWANREFNLLKFAGSTIKIQFGTYNDGGDGVTALYVDDVSLRICR